MREVTCKDSLSGGSNRMNYKPPRPEAEHPVENVFSLPWCKVIKAGTGEVTMRNGKKETFHLPTHSFIQQILIKH